MKAGSVCSGYGGLDMAAHELLDTTPTWFADVDPAASRVLEHHWPDVPNLGDITAVDWNSVEPVGVLTGGTPCQDLSPAGKRAGMGRGTRSGLWHAMCDAIGALRPRLVLWENVRGALSAKADSAVEPCPRCLGVGDERPVLRALGRVLGDLASLRYDAVWCGLPAAAVGCAHLRWRVFLAASPRSDTAQVRRWTTGWDDGIRTAGLESGGGAPRDTASSGRDAARLAGRGDRPARPAGGPGVTAGRRDCTVAHPHIDELARQRVQQPGGATAARRGVNADVDWREYGPAIKQHERMIGRPAPAPTVIGRRGGPNLSPHFTEWLMGLPEGHVTSVPGLSVNDMLRLCGNGVVKQQAVAAYRHLLPILFESAGRAA